MCHPLSCYKLPLTHPQLSAFCGSFSVSCAMQKYRADPGWRSALPQAAGAVDSRVPVDDRRRARFQPGAARLTLLPQAENSANDILPPLCVSGSRCPDDRLRLYATGCAAARRNARAASPTDDPAPAWVTATPCHHGHLAPIRNDARKPCLCAHAFSRPCQADSSGIGEY